ncbi:beta-lactamase class c [Leptolyngbya sp. Heron Island J]|nr:beta-lactamase class c [Leptolyngbya sp. Heron Island J]
MSALANGGQVEGMQALPNAAVALAISNLLPDNISFDGFGAFSSEGQGFGAGGRVWIRSTNIEPVGTYGFASAASAIATAVPSQNTAIVMMTQMLFATEMDMMQDITEAFASDVLSEEETVGSESLTNSGAAR